MNEPEDYDDTAFWALFGTDAVVAYRSLDPAPATPPRSAPQPPQAAATTKERP